MLLSYLLTFLKHFTVPLKKIKPLYTAIDAKADQLACFNTSHYSETWALSSAIQRKKLNMVYTGEGVKCDNVMNNEYK